MLLTEWLRLQDFRCLIYLTEENPGVDRIAAHDFLQTASFNSRSVVKLVILSYVYLLSSVDCNRYSRQPNFDLRLRCHSASTALSFHQALPLITIVYGCQRQFTAEQV